MTSKPQLLLLSFLLLVSAFVCAQTIGGRITDAKSGETLAFVAVAEVGTVNGTYSDIDGYYTITLSDPTQSIAFNLMGFEPLILKWNGEPTMDIKLSEKENVLNEVVIRPGVNPAERIIRKAIENKKINNPESDIAFTYDSYNKLAFGGQVDSSLMGDSTRFNSLDTSMQKAYKFLDEQYLFLMESATKRKFYPPNHSEETIIANRVSGLKTTDFFLLGTQLQSFSFYGETVDLLGVSYMSPLANNAINKYLFILEDTTFIGVDTVFTISFQPRIKKNFSGMKGQLFINTNGFAIQNVIADPAEASGFNIHIQQQYEFVDGRKWFPKQLNSSILFSQFIANGIPVAGEGRSYIKNLKLDAPVKKSEFSPVTLLIAPKAGTQPDSVWNQYRERELDSKELKTYVTIDSVGKEVNLDRKLKVFEALTTGMIAVGPVGFDIRRLFAYNSYEKARVGLGVRTSNLLSEKFTAGAYYAYGFGDQHSKYGGDLLVHLYRKRNLWIKAIYENDVMELGGNQFDKPVEGLALTNLYPLFLNRMDRREKTELILNGRLIGNLSVSGFVNKQFVRPYESYRFVQASDEDITLYQSQFNITETGVTFRFAPGEKLVRTTSREIRLGGRFPVLWLKITNGLKNVLDGDYNYTRIDARVDKIFKINNVGQFSVTSIAGYVPNNIPLSLLYNARGTYQQFTIAVPQSFETMRTNEFQHSQFVAVHLRHNFLDLLIKTKNFRPHILLVQNLLWGKMDYPENHNFDIQSASKGFYESGIQFDNLLVSSFSSLGIGAFYRYGPYHLADQKENFAVKFTAGFSF